MSLDCDLVYVDPMTRWPYYLLQIEQCLLDADIQLSVELWFTEEELREETVLQQLSTRTITVHVKHDSGVHHYLPLQFDYFHLSAILLTIHASLLALHPSYVRCVTVSSEKRIVTVAFSVKKTKWIKLVLLGSIYHKVSHLLGDFTFWLSLLLSEIYAKVQTYTRVKLNVGLRLLLSLWTTLPCLFWLNKSASGWSEFYLSES